MPGDINQEDTERKSLEEVKKVYEKHGKYYCTECHSELPVKKSCPICKKEIDWERIISESR